MRPSPPRLLLPVVLLLSCGPAKGPAARVGAGDPDGAGDSSDRGCNAEPLGSFLAFLEIGGPSSSTLEATLVSIPPAGDGGFHKVALREASGAGHVLTLRSPLGPPPLREGRRYRFRVDYAPGYPPASGLLVWEGAELIYAALSDPSRVRHGLEHGMPGFETTLLPSACGSRAHSNCYESLKNARLRIDHDGESATLMQGESGTLGRYTVTCLTAEEVVYSSACADAGRVVLSYVIALRESRR